MKEFKCKDCVHYCVCRDTVTEDNWTDDTPVEIREIFSPKYCENFFLAADVAPVVHAEWELVHIDDNDMPAFRCSHCGRKILIATPNYCSNCGCKMIGYTIKE